MTNMTIPTFNNQNTTYQNSGSQMLLGYVQHSTAENAIRTSKSYFTNPLEGAIESIDFTAENDTSINKHNPKILHNYSEDKIQILLLNFIIFCSK
jgi:hypothetical protein